MLTPAEYNQLLWYLNEELKKSQTAIHAELERFERAYGSILNRYVATGPTPPTPEPPPSGHVKNITLNWGGDPVDTATAAPITPDTTIVGRLAVPGTATSPQNSPGLISVVEFDGPPVQRLMTLSTRPNDFRGYQPGLSGLPPTDPSGANAPMVWSIGINPNCQFLLAGDTGGPTSKLTPGQTYYVNLRTVHYGSGEPSCSAAACNVRFTVNPPR